VTLLGVGKGAIVLSKQIYLLVDSEVVACQFVFFKCSEYSYNCTVLSFAILNLLSRFPLVARLYFITHAVKFPDPKLVDIFCKLQQQYILLLTVRSVES